MQEEKFDISNIDDLERIENLGIALASPIRVKILRQLNDGGKTLSELAQLNMVSFSSVMFHVNLLEKASLVKIIEVKTRKGKTKMIYKGCLHISVSLASLDERKDCSIENFHQSIPVGYFTDAKFGTNNGYVTIKDTKNFYSDAPFNLNRFDAGIIYTNKGYVEYSFDNSYAKGKRVVEISFSLEICSETPFYNNEFESLIGFSVNDIELCSYLSPGDFGGRRGKYNPDTLGNQTTQYGCLVKIDINRNGVYLNGILVDVKNNLDKLNIMSNNCIRFKIESKQKDGLYGGFNIFGKNFGDYNQDIEMIISTFKD